jgi:AraC-like DNA-binding protein/transposase-like protein
MLSGRGIKSGEPAGFTVAAVYALQVAEVARRLGVASAELFRGLDLSEDSLASPGAVMRLETFEQVIERARTLTGEPGLAVVLGLQERVSAHGFLGFAAMTAATLRQAIELAVHFAPTRSNAIALRLETNPREAAIVVEERVPLGRTRDVIILGLMVGLWKIGDSITGRELVGHLECSFAQPEYFSRFAAVANDRCRFDQPANRIVFDMRLLDAPLVMADPGAMRLAREQCERELAAIAEQRSFVARVRVRMFTHGSERFIALDALASEFAMSTRTFKRKLEEQGTSYSKLLEELRRARATELLRSELSIAEIAERLGYSDAANFTRAFRRWTGQSPRAFRD